MIRIMIVEDEPPIARSIAHLVEEWDGPVRVVHTAINGKRALEYLEQEPVDLIFSDIKMPVMDGISLAEQLNSRYPGIRMVIISGFQEFEYARSAIRYGVSSYLLKPVSREALHETLDTLCPEILRSRDTAAREMLEKAMRNEGAVSGLPRFEQCGVFLLCAGAWPLTPDELMPASNEVWDHVDLEACMSSLLMGRETCICLGGRSLAEKAVVFSADSEARIREVATALYEVLERAPGAAVTLAVNESPISMDGVGEAFNRLRKRLYREIRLFTPGLIFSRQEDSGDSREPSEQIKTVVLSLKGGERSAVDASFRELMDTFVSRRVRQTELVVYLEKLAMNYFEGILSLRQMGEIRAEIQGAVSSALTPEELAEELAQVFYAWTGAENRMDRSRLPALCEAVADYIRLNYKANISSSALSRQFGVSSTQLAKKFREYSGFSIAEYVNNYRIELAQAMMRSNPGRRIKEIALEVGYRDQYYFSKIFKKITGIWPTEYLKDGTSEKNAEKTEHS